MSWKRPTLIIAVVLASIAGAFALTPMICAEAFIVSLQSNASIVPPPANPSAFDAASGVPSGTVVDAYWRLQALSPDTWAIGEPQDAPDNYEYLIIGKTRALLIDAGSSRMHDIHTVLRKLTKLPITVIPSHLHFDHTNGLANFDSIALVDLPETRAREKDGYVQLSRYEFINNHPPRFRVTEWIKPDSIIDLGGRRVKVLATPGHTATSVSIFDPANHTIFTGDYIYPTTLYAFMPDSSLSAYESTADHLLNILPPTTKLYGAHCCRNDNAAQAPWLSLDDLRDIRSMIRNIRSGKAEGARGLILRRYPVNTRMTIVTLYPFGNY